MGIYTDACWRHVEQLHSSAQFVVHFAAYVPAAVKMPTVKHLCQWLGIVLCVVDYVEMLVPSRSSPRPGSLISHITISTATRCICIVSSAEVD